MNREPVNPDDPQMTAYALGEMTLAERIEFESRLQESPLAQRELAEMEEIMDLLSEGLRGEWTDEISENERSFTPVLVENASEENIVAGQFVASKKRVWGAVAAALGALALVGGTFFAGSGGDSGLMASGSTAAIDGDLLLSSAATVMVVADAELETSSFGEVHVPKLLKFEEISAEENLSDLDASYLEPTGAVPVAYMPEGIEVDRVDSYLPPVSEVDDTVRVSRIEQRLNDRSARFASLSDSESRFLLRGFVSMDGGSAAAGQGGNGIELVSMSGAPILDSEKDLKILAELSGVQRELEVLSSQLEPGSTERIALEKIVSRNKRAMLDLKREFAR